MLAVQLAIAMAALGCSSPEQAPTAPSASLQRGTDALVVDRAPSDRPPSLIDPFATLDVVFPPRDQSLRFRLELEAYYRDVLRRGATTSFVDLEGTIVWTQEYLRYRVNGCNHADATSRVMSIINGGSIPPVCSAAATSYPPRNEPFEFRQALEAIYRDTLRRGATVTYVDTEGDIVWTTEYFRYRTMGCSDTQSATRVIEQVAGSPASSNCGGACAITLSEPQVSFDRTGGSRTVTVTTGGGCSWSASSDSPWLTINGASSGSGTGTLRYEVAPLTQPGTRIGIITIGDQQLRVRQVAEAVSARFVMRQGGSATGSCNLGGSGVSNCSLDGTSSEGAITSYQWTTTRFRTSGNVTQSWSGSTVELGQLPCTAQGNSQGRSDVTLPVSTSGGQPPTLTESLSLSRAGCGT